MFMNKLFTPQHFLIMLVISITIAHCAKKTEEIKTNLIMDAMSAGKWKVQIFKEDNKDVTTEFSAYEFQFFKDGSVKGYYGGETATGTWAGDINASTISS